MAISATNNNRGFYKNDKIIQTQIKKLNCISKCEETEKLLHTHENGGQQ